MHVVCLLLEHVGARTRIQAGTWPTISWNACKLLYISAQEAHTYQHAFLEHGITRTASCFKQHLAGN